MRKFFTLAPRFLRAAACAAVVLALTSCAVAPARASGFLASMHRQGAPNTPTQPDEMSTAEREVRATCRVTPVLCPQGVEAAVAEARANGFSAYARPLRETRSGIPQGAATALSRPLTNEECTKLNVQASADRFPGQPMSAEAREAWRRWEEQCHPGVLAKRAAALLDIAESRMARANIGLVDAKALRRDGEDELGVIDGIPYRLFADGSASFGTHELRRGFDINWNVRIRTDNMHDDQTWMVSQRGLAVGMIRTKTGRRSHFAFITNGKYGCYPGSIEYLRIDHATPLQVACDDYWDEASTKRIIAALSRGTEALTRYTAWPSRVTQDETISLNGFAVAWRYVQWLSQQPMKTANR
jgi:hypothetical protein